jgi:hypothetical protein
MRMAEPQIQRPCACGATCAKCQTQQPDPAHECVQTKRIPSIDSGHGAAPPIVRGVLAASGQPLALATRRFMEPRFGHDFGRVRVHTDRVAADSAESIGARAYTAGHHVVFGAGQYRLSTADGRRLLAHELAHVTQQTAGAPLGGTMLQRDNKAPAKNTAAGGPKLDFRPPKNPPPCACIVFIHHNEPNARLIAQLMHEFCHYNLAIVDPQTSDRQMKLPGKGMIDPNELFPRNVAEECWNDDKPCEDFLTKNAGATTAALVEEYAQRQFFLAIKKCSNSFALPVLGLHNNTIDDTASYRKALRDTKGPLDVTPIKGKTFDDTLKAGEKSKDPHTQPFADLQEWLLKNVPGVQEKPEAEKAKEPTAKRTIQGGPFVTNKTNIFIWCAAKDNSRCHIGDPERPDNVVWVTNADDFKKLQSTKTNVVLQTRVDPTGNSATDLSSLFVFLDGIVGAHFASLLTKLNADVAVETAAIDRATKELEQIKVDDEHELGRLRAIVVKGIIEFHVKERLEKLKKVTAAQAEQKLKQSQLRFINIETPQSPYESTTKPKDLRVQSYRDVKATLAALGLDCCPDKPDTGETESAVEKVEKALEVGKMSQA